MRLLPYGNMLVACARERLSRPPLPAVPESQSGELGHEIKLCRPHIPEGYRSVRGAAVHDLHIVRAHCLRRDVVEIERQLRRANVKRHGELAHGELSELWNHDLDNEIPARRQMRCSVPEAVYLRGLVVRFIIVLNTK